MSYIFKSNFNIPLQVAKQYSIDENLKDIVKQSKDGKISYGIIRGTVKPIGQPIQSVMSPSVTGVLQVIKLRFVYQKYFTPTSN